MSSFPFVGGAYMSRSKNFDAQRCVNLYAEMSESGNSKSVAMLVGTPGLQDLFDLPGATGPIRGFHRFNDNLAVAVSDNSVFSIVPPSGVNLIGLISSGETKVSMADNGAVVMLMTGQEGYFVDPVAGTVTLISDPDFVAGRHVSFLAGRFVWPKTDTGQFQWTEVYGTAIDALSFSTAEASPDVIVAQIAGFGELWEFGQNTTEVFQPSNDADEPYVKVQGAAMEIGCTAPYSVAKIDSSFLWLGRSDEGIGIVWRAVNYQPQRISTHAIEFAIASYGDVSDAIAFTYQQEGHSFYVLSFPAANKTWCYDVSTGLWHERTYRDPATGDMQRIRPVCQMQFDGDTIVGDRELPRLYRLRLDVYQDGAQVLIPRIRACHHLSEDLKPQFFHALQIDMETGVGLEFGQGIDPQAMLRWSDDGGHTWSNSHWTTMGRQGKYLTRARWRRLGYSRDRVFEVTITDPVKVCIIGASADVTVGV